MDLIPSYKAHRVAEPEPAGEPDVEEVPDDLTPQVDMIMELLDAFGIATAGAEGFEADDVLGTLAAQERSDPVVVVSGDRDLLQVVADDPVPVRVLYLGRGLAKATLFGPAEVAEHYGVPVDRAGPAYAELALLRGDPSDGLPGVPGVGEKTAATLLAQYGSLEQILAAAHDPKSKMAKGIAGETAGRDRLHRGRRSGGPGGHRRAGHAVDAHRRATAGRRRPAAHRGAGHANSAWGPRLPVCRKRSTRCRSDALLRPADLVGALVVLEGHRHALRAPSMLTAQSKVPPFFTVGSVPLLHLTSLTFFAP